MQYRIQTLRLGGGGTLRLGGGGGGKNKGLPRVPGPLPWIPQCDVL